MHAAVRVSGRLAAGVMGVAALCAATPSYAGFSVGPALRPVPATLTLEPPLPERTMPESIPAPRYGNLEPAVCEGELARRAIPYTRVDEARGVLAPIRLTGPLHGVTFASIEPATRRPTSPLEILDCRLALALDDFAAQLATHGIVRVVHFSMYRPPPRGWPAARTGSRHTGALAIDAALFVKDDGTKLDVLHDFHGRIGATTCGPGTGPHPATPEAVELRQIVCDAVDARLFNIALTPDFNWPHRNHFHLEVKAGASTMYVH